MLRLERLGKERKKLEGLEGMEEVRKARGKQVIVEVVGKEEGRLGRGREMLERRKGNGIIRREGRGYENRDEWCYG